MTVTGPTFVALQVRNIERAAEFYETRLGLSLDPPSCFEQRTAQAS